MNVEFTALAVGVFLFVVLIWDQIRVWNPMRASEAQFKKMQQEINFLQMRESRRSLMELNEYSKAEASKINPDNAPVEIGGGDVDAHLTRLNFVSTESDTWTPPPLSQRSRYSFSGVSILLFISTIAAPLVYILVFESSASMDIAMLSTTPQVDTQSAVPAPPSKMDVAQALPSMSEPQGILEGILAGTERGVEREVYAPPLPTKWRLESQPNESDLTPPPPRDLESRTSERGAVLDLRRDSDVPHLHEAQESSPPKMILAIASATAPLDTPAVTQAPLPQALLPPTEAQGLAARTETEAGGRTPSIQATRRSERRQNESDGTALQPTPDLESRTSESRMAVGAAEPPQRVARPQEPTDRIILEEPAPQIVPDLLQTVPLPRASPRPRPRLAKPKLTVAAVGTPAPAASLAKPPVAPAPVTARPPAASNWWKKLLGDQD